MGEQLYASLANLLHEKTPHLAYGWSVWCVSTPCPSHTALQLLPHLASSLADLHPRYVGTTLSQHCASVHGMDFYTGRFVRWSHMWRYAGISEKQNWAVNLIASAEMKAE